MFCSSMLFGQEVQIISGRVELMSNPCLTEVCIPGILWGLNVDTALYVLDKNGKWIWAEDSLIIYGTGYSEGDSVKFYGQLSTWQDWKGDDYTEARIVNMEICDTAIANDQSLTLEFFFWVFDCGIYVYDHPAHAELSRLSYNNTYDTAIYVYQPLTGFNGTDTIMLVTGCGSTADYNSAKLLVYRVHVGEESRNEYLDQPAIKVYPNPSPGEIQFEFDNDHEYNLVINNLLGQRVYSSPLQKGYSVILSRGVYLITIMEQSNIVYNQQLIIQE